MEKSDIVGFDKAYNGIIIGGCDEAGRGPLAGPVCVACCIMPLDDIIDGVNDSKQVTEKKRNMLYDLIIAKAIKYSVTFVDEETIDTINILNATKQGMKKVIEECSPDLCLVDAVPLNIGVKTESIIKGDAKSYNIACASILAKVTRDRYMIELDKKYPEYNFKKHKGYGTKEHITRLREYGPSPVHRRSFIGHFVNIDHD